MSSSERRRQYRAALTIARCRGVSDDDIAEVIVALGPNPCPDDLSAALWTLPGFMAEMAAAA